MAYSGLHRAPDKCDALLAAAGGAALLVVIAALSAWAHYSLSVSEPHANRAATPPARASTAPLPSQVMRAQLRTWLTEAEPSINALVTTRHEIASAAANHDITKTGAACQTADGAVANFQHQLPSPDPVLNTLLQQAIAAYHIGVHYCTSGVQKNDANDIEQAANYIDQGNAGLEAAVDILQRSLADSEAGDPSVMLI
jgi:hypothetical protein